MSHFLIAINYLPGNSTYIGYNILHHVTLVRMYNLFHYYSWRYFRKR